MELDRLISTYEITIKQQREEIEQLVLLLQKSEDEKETLLKTLEINNLKEKALNEEPLPDSVNDNNSFNSTYKEIEPSIFYDSIDEMQKLLSEAKRMWRRMDIEKLTHVFKKMNEHPHFLEFDNGEINKDILSLFKSILLKEDLNELEHDQLVNEIIDLGSKLKESSLETQVNTFLKRNNGKVSKILFQEMSLL